MIALTIGGQAGAGGPEVGLVIAQDVGARYVRRLAVRRLARRLNATVDAVSRKELSFSSRWRQALDIAEAAFLRMGYFGTDPYGSLSMQSLLVGAAGAPVRTSPGEIPDVEYIDALHETARELVAEDDTVLVKRAGTVSLRGLPGVVHVGLFASADARVARMARRLGVGMADARDALSALEKARHAWYRRLGGDDPADPANYDFCLHTDHDEADAAIARRATEMAGEFLPGIRASLYRMLPTPLIEEHTAHA